MIKSGGLVARSWNSVSQYPHERLFYSHCPLLCFDISLHLLWCNFCKKNYVLLAPKIDISFIWIRYVIRWPERKLPALKCHQQNKFSEYLNYQRRWSVSVTYDASLFWTHITLLKPPTPKSNIRKEEWDKRLHEVQVSKGWVHLFFLDALSVSSVFVKGWEFINGNLADQSWWAQKFACIIWFSSNSPFPSPSL